MNTRFIDEPIELDTIDTSGTSLHRAVIESNLDQVNFILSVLKEKNNLLEYVNKTDADGNTALHLVFDYFRASTKKFEQVIYLLIRAGTDLYLVNNKGYTALDLLTSLNKNIFTSLIMRGSFLTSFIGKEIPFSFKAKIDKINNELSFMFLLGTQNVPHKLKHYSDIKQCLEVFKNLEAEDKKHVLEVCKMTLLTYPFYKIIAPFYLTSLQSSVIPLRELLVAKLQFDPKIFSYYVNKQQSAFSSLVYESYKPSSQKGKEKSDKIESILSLVPVNLLWEIPWFVRNLQYAGDPLKNIELKKCNYQLANDNRIRINKLINLINQVRNLKEKCLFINFNKNDKIFMICLGVLGGFVGLILSIMINIEAMKEKEANFKNIADMIMSNFIFFFITVPIFVSFFFLVGVCLIYPKAIFFNEGLSEDEIEKKEELITLITSHSNIKLIQSENAHFTEQILNNLKDNLIQISEKKKLSRILPVLEDVEQNLIALREIINQSNQPVFEENSFTFFQSQKDGEKSDIANSQSFHSQSLAYELDYSP